MRLAPIVVTMFTCDPVHMKGGIRLLLCVGSRTIVLIYNTSNGRPSCRHSVQAQRD